MATVSFSSQVGAQSSDGKYFVCTANSSDPKASGSCQEVNAKPSDVTTYYTCTVGNDGNYNCNYTGVIPLPPDYSYLQTATINMVNGNYVYTPTGPSSSNTLASQGSKNYAQMVAPANQSIIIWIIIVLIIFFVIISVNKK